MTNKLFAFSLMIITSSVMHNSAQVTINKIDDNILEIINDSTIPSQTVYKILLDNAPVEPRYPNIPRFAIVGKNNKFYLSIGATIKATKGFDWGTPLNSADSFLPSNIIFNDNDNKSKFHITLRHSKIHFSFVALPGTTNQFSTYISIKFTGNGNSYGATLQNAYAKYLGLTVGYKNTLYSDDASMPYTIDSQGPNSSPCITNTCFNYEHSFSKNFRVGIGIEDPLYKITETSNSTYDFPERILKTEIIGKSKAISQRFPDIPLYLQYKFSNDTHIRISGILRVLEYRNLNENKNCSNFGWGMKISSKYKYNNLSAYFMAQYGNGIASYLQDNNMGIDLVPDMSTPGKMQLTKSWGAYLGIQFDFSDKISSTIIYSHLRNYMDKYTGGDIEYDNNYKWGQYACANIIYSLNTFIQFGIEYIYGRRESYNSDQAHNNRLQSMFQITF